jgi:hypothetical protein
MLKCWRFWKRKFDILLKYDSFFQIFIRKNLFQVYKVSWVTQFSIKYNLWDREKKSRKINLIPHGVWGFSYKWKMKESYILYEKYGIFLFLFILKDIRFFFSYPRSNLGIKCNVRSRNRNIKKKNHIHTSFKFYMQILVWYNMKEKVKILFL